MKKMLSLFLVLLMFCAPFTAVSADNTEPEYTYRVKNDNSIIITYTTGASGEVTIPSVLDGHPVSEIDSYAFYYSPELTGITIPEGVVRIGDDAFGACRKLEYVRFPDSLKSVGNKVFESCESLASIELSARHPYLRLDRGVLYARKEQRLLSFPEGLPISSYEVLQGTREIASGAFYSSQLEQLTLPDSLKVIEDEAFIHCWCLEALTIPASVESIGTQVFYGCHSLKSVQVAPDSRFFTIDEGVLYAIGDPTPLYSTQGNHAADFIVADGVTQIPPAAFADSKIQSVVLPDTVTVIGDFAFDDCAHLSRIDLGSSLCSIGAFAFADCEYLCEMTIPASVTSIESSAFWNTPVTLLVENGSYAKEFAEENEIPYQIVESSAKASSRGTGKTTRSGEDSRGGQRVSRSGD